MALGADRLVAHADQPRHGVLAEVLAHEGRAPAALAGALRQRFERQALDMPEVVALGASEVEHRRRNVERQHEVVVDRARL